MLGSDRYNINEILKSIPNVDVVKYACVAYTLYSVAKKISQVSFSDVLNAIPGANSLVDAQLKKEVAENLEGMFPSMPLLDDKLDPTEIPSVGLSTDLIQRQLNKWQSLDASAEGTHFAYTYASGNKELTDFNQRVFMQFQNENALNPTAFPALRFMEVSVCAMVANLFNGDANTVGSMTSGGSESLLCMLKAYRDYARLHWPHIKNPRVVTSISVHPAVNKAAHMLGVELDCAPIDENGRVCMTTLETLIGPNTILLIASAPAYPHGVMDPVEAIAELGKKYAHQNRNIPVHVDACIGGFILPFVERIKAEEKAVGKLSEPVPLWDFRVEGVTSISADTHKYGFTCKGSSVLLYKNDNFRKHQFFASGEWPGGLFISPSVLGTRSGGSIAATWSSLMTYGLDNWMSVNRKAYEASLRLREGIKNIPELQVIGSPEASILAVRSVDPEVHIFAVADAVEMGKITIPSDSGEIEVELGEWSMERQQHPDCIHFTVMPNHAPRIDGLLKDLTAAIKYARAHPEMTSKGSCAMYGAVAAAPSSSLVDKFLIEFETQVYTRNWRTHIVNEDVSDVEKKNQQILMEGGQEEECGLNM